MKHLFRYVSALALVLLLSAGTITLADTCTTSCSTCTTSCSTCDCDPCSCGTCYDDCCDSCCDDDVYCKSHFSPRSQGLAGDRRLVGSVHRTHLYDKDEFYGTFDVALAYQRTFKEERLGRFISPKCGCNCFNIGADAQTDTDVRNHDFGVECTGQTCFKPRIESFIADFNFFMGLNSWAEGLFVEVQMPLVHTWWKNYCTDCCCTDDSDCAEYFAAGGDLMDVNNSDSATVSTSLVTALQGQSVWGSVNSGLCCGVLCCGKQSDTALADLRVRLGYDFWLSENGSLGLKLVMAAPTGTRPGSGSEGRNIWEPIAGNSAHWEVGGGIYGKALLWDKDEDKSFSMVLDVEATHMFGSRTNHRLFDLCANGCWSRYLLLKKFDEDGDIASLERGPNVFCQAIKTKVDVQVDATLLFNFKWNNWMVDFGYNGWYRSREKCHEFCPCIAADTYGIKGNELATDNNTASTSTIKTAGDADDETVFIGTDASIFNIDSALHPSTHSHAVFAHAAYTWDENEWVPAVGVGGKVEFSGRGNRAANQWSIWLKGGVSF